MLVQSSRIRWDDNTTSINDEQLTNAFLEVVAAALDPLPGHYPARIHIEIPDPDPTMEATIAGIAAESTATCITHPRTDVLTVGSIFRLRSEGTVVVDMVMTTSY
ncbi:hypothetical protein KCV01_g19896, partial [Aureobasidium melanogenum]